MEFIDDIFGTDDVILVNPSPSVNKPPPVPKKTVADKQPIQISSKKSSKSSESKKQKITISCSSSFSVIKATDLNALKNEDSPVLLEKVTAMMDEIDLASEKTRAITNMLFDRRHHLEEENKKLKSENEEVYAKNYELTVCVEDLEAKTFVHRSKREFLLNEALKRNKAIADMHLEISSLRQTIANHKEARKKKRSLMSKSYISFCYGLGSKDALNNPSLVEAISSDGTLIPSPESRNEITNFIKSSIDKLIIPVAAHCDASLTQEEVTNLLANPADELKEFRRSLKAKPGDGKENEGENIDEGLVNQRDE